MILRQAVDVPGIVEQTFTLQLHMTGIVLSETLQAWPADRGGVRPPVSGSQLPQPIRPCTNPAIDCGDQVAIRYQVQNTPAPGPIHTRKKKIAIQRGTIAFFLVHGRRHWIHPEVRGGCALAQIIRDGLHFKTTNIAPSRVIQAVKVVFLDDIKIDERNIFKPRPDLALRYHPANASGTHYAGSQACKVRLTLFAPG